MISQHPLKQFLRLTREHWDHPGTPAHARETFLSILNCGTIVLGAEVMPQRRSGSLYTTPASRDSVQVVGNAPRRFGRRNWRPFFPTFPTLA